MMRSDRLRARSVAVLAGLLTALAPAAALACPYCAGRAKGGIATNIILGAFVFLPFVLSWALYRVIRTHEGASDPGKSGLIGGDPRTPSPAGPMLKVRRNA
jgi:hypothetical protein